MRSAHFYACVTDGSERGFHYTRVLGYRIYVEELHRMNFFANHPFREVHDGDTYTPVYVSRKWELREQTTGIIVSYGTFNTLRSIPMEARELALSQSHNLHTRIAEALKQGKLAPGQDPQLAATLALPETVSEEQVLAWLEAGKAPAYCIFGCTLPTNEHFCQHGGANILHLLSLA